MPPPGGGGSRAENSEISPRVPSISCRSMARSRSFSSDVALEQLVALDDDQHVEFARGKAVRDLLVGLVFGRVGAEQLAERIVDLQPLEADCGGAEQDDEDAARR